MNRVKIWLAAKQAYSVSMRLKQVRFIDHKYIKLVIVCLKTYVIKYMNLKFRPKYLSDYSENLQCPALISTSLCEKRFKILIVIHCKYYPPP